MRNGVVAAELALKHDAIAELAEQRIGVAVGGVIAADMRRAEAKELERRANGALEGRGVGSGGRRLQRGDRRGGARRRLRGSRERRQAGGIERGPVVNGLVEPEPAVGFFDDERLTSTAQRALDILRKRGVDMLTRLRAVEKLPALAFR